MAVGACVIRWPYQKNIEPINTWIIMAMMVLTMIFMITWLQARAPRWPHQGSARWGCLAPIWGQLLCDSGDNDKKMVASALSFWSLRWTTKIIQRGNQLYSDWPAPPGTPWSSFWKPVLFLQPGSVYLSSTFYVHYELVTKRASFIFRTILY